MFDCHIHSNFSGDSEMSVETACEKAISLGLDGIVFTDHLDFDYPGYPDETFTIDFTNYLSYLDKAKSRYIGRLKLVKGIEVGIQPHVLDKSLEVVSSHPFDHVIASVHIIDKQDPYTNDYFIGKTKNEAYIRYLEEVLYSVKNFNNYDIVGHIGYLRRYGSYDDRSLRQCDYSDLLDSILKQVVISGKGIEINSSGYRNKLGSPIPDYDIVSRFKELGGEIISIGSDAHYPEHIAHDFKIVEDKLKEIGFKHTVHFEDRRPVFDKL